MIEVQFLIEATETSGLGRVRRSATLAKTMANLGALVSILRPEILHAVPLINVFDLNITDDVSPSAQIIVVDGSPDYQFAIMDSLPTGAKIVAIDDIANCRLNADIIVNPNLYAAQLDYSYLGSKRVLTGPIHNMLDPRFFNNGNEERDIDILISFGGSDTEEYLVAVSNYFATLHTSLNIRIASAFPLPKANYAGIPVMIGEDMHKTLKRSKVYLGGAGTTVQESLAAGCQIVATRIADDQAMNLLYLRFHDVATCDFFDAEALCHMAIEAVSTQTHYGIKISKTGPDRIAKALLA